MSYRNKSKSTKLPDLKILQEYKKLPEETSGIVIDYKTCILKRFYYNESINGRMFEFWAIHDGKKLPGWLFLDNGVYESHRYFGYRHDSVGTPEMSAIYMFDDYDCMIGKFLGIYDKIEEILEEEIGIIENKSFLYEAITHYYHNRDLNKIKEMYEKHKNK